MVHGDAAVSEQVRLPAGPRPVRAVLPPESPWPATLVRDAAGTARLLVAGEQLPASPLLLADADGHIAVPLDLVRHEGGHALVMPLCVRRVAEFLQQRADADAPLSDGEAVTLGVSVARGTVDALLAAGDEQATGEWWLDDGGRPLFVVGEGHLVRDAAHGVLEHAARVCRTGSAGVRAALAETAALVTRDGGLRAGLDDAERRLFATASPEALATAVLAPARARRVSATRDAEPIDTDLGAWSWASLMPHVDAALPEFASRVGMTLWRRLRADRPRTRRRPLLWAASVAAALIAVGLLWPQGSGAPASAGTEGRGGSPAPTSTPAAATHAASAEATSSPAAASSAGPHASPSHAVPSPVPTAATAAEAVDALLERRAACADTACRARTQEVAAENWKSGAAELDRAQRTLTMLDDFGDVAVFRVHPRAGELPDQLVVTVRRNGSWLLRDIQDVEQQP